MKRSERASMKTRKEFMYALAVALSLVPGQSGARNSSSANLQAASSRRQDMKIKIAIGGRILTARLADNATAQDFASILPLHVTMNDLFGREKYGDLPKALSKNGPSKNKYEVGEIAYWSPAKQFAVYYHQDGETIPSPGIIPIAKIDACTEVFKVPGSVKVMIEIAK